MELRVLPLNPDKREPLFDSPESQQLLEIYKNYYPEIGFDLPWVAYLIVKDNQVMGTGSFTGKPQNGSVEIAYWTFKQFEGQGVASFACGQLINIAKNHDPNICITAKTAPEHNASTKILEKHDFVYRKVVQDEDIGDAWLWELKLAFQ